MERLFFGIGLFVIGIGAYLFAGLFGNDQPHRNGFLYFLASSIILFKIMNRKTKYRILRLAKGFEVQQKILFWWKTVNEFLDQSPIYDPRGFIRPLKFKTKEEASNWIKKRGGIIVALLLCLSATAQDSTKKRPFADTLFPNVHDTTFFPIYKNKNMKTVYKYTLDKKKRGAQDIEIHAGAEVTTAAIQGQELVIWATVETQNSTRRYRFIIAETGDELEFDRPMRSLGSVILMNGLAVLHIFVEK